MSPRSRGVDAGPRSSQDQALLAAVFAFSNDVVAIMDEDWRITYVTPSVEAVFGLRPCNLVGRTAFSFFEVDESHGASTFSVASRVKPGSRLDVTGRIEADDGTRLVEVTVHNRVDDPVIRGFIANVRDVTVQTQTMRELIDEQQRTNAIVAHSGDVIAYLDVDGTIVWVSAASRNLFGIEPSDIVGLNGFALIHPDDQERCLAEFMSMPNMGDHARVEFRHIDGSGRTLWIEEEATNLLDDPHVGFIVVNLRDVTERRQMQHAQAQLSAIVESSHDAMFSQTLDGVVTSWNQGATQLFGYEANDIIGCSVAPMVTPDSGDEVADIFQTIRDGGDIRDLEAICYHQDGSEVLVSLSIDPIRDAAGTIVAASTIAHDITERARLAQRQREDRRRLGDSQRLAHLGSFEVDLATGSRVWSDELFRVLGRPLDFVPREDSIVELVHPDDVAEYLRFRSSFTDDGVGDGSPCTVRIVRPDGTMRWVALQVSPLVEGVIGGTVLDVTDRKAAEDELAHRAHHDPLTDLPNRALIAEQLEVALAEHVGTTSAVAVAFLDLDQFKVINDSLGHALGDQLLIAVADRLREGAHPSDTVGRFGGDEFIVIRRGCADARGLAWFAEQLRCSVEEPFLLDDREFFLKASVGVTLSTPNDTASDVLRDADTAMYVAKDRGRDRSEVFDEDLRRRTQDKLDIATELRCAVELGQLWLAFQPVVTLGDGTIVGFEALLRWDHPVRGSVSPADFIPVAEETGLIVPIGSWVLREALDQLAAWRASTPGTDDLWMAINLSATQLERPGIVETIRTAVNESDVPPELVHIEITESVLMDNIDQSIATVGALRSLGFRISVDDFGTGYSSLSYLKQLPLDTLKIDQSFVSGLGHDLQDRSIAQAIIALADALDLDVLAEGIETWSQAATLIELGCGLGQGYLWSRPLPPQQAIALLEELAGSAAAGAPGRA